MIYWVDLDFPDIFHTFRDCPSLESAEGEIGVADELGMTARICNICDARLKTGDDD